MELVIFKSAVNRLKNGSIEPNVDWGYADLIVSGSALYNTDKSECIVFVKTLKPVELTDILKYFGFVILTGAESESEFKALSDIDYKEYIEMVKNSVREWVLPNGL
jgi:hypothetical protein